MARFAVGLSLYLFVGSFAFAQTDTSVEILPRSCKLARITIPSGFWLRLRMARETHFSHAIRWVTRSIGKSKSRARRERGIVAGRVGIVGWKKYPDRPIRSTRAQFALFWVWRGQHAEAGICHPAISAVT
jgi:hypothetical protein